MKTFFKSVVVNILTAEAKYLLKRTQPKIIAITGSVGKTTTKDAVFHAIKDSVSARKSEKSYNSDIGVALTILGLDNAWQNPILWLKNIIEGLFLVLFPGKYPEVLVLEMGVDRPGDMARLTSWIKPDAVILTRLPDVPVHVEYFASPDDVIKEKVTLVEALATEGVFIYNNDDEKVCQVAGTVRQKSYSFSRYSSADFMATADKIVYANGIPTGTSFTITHNEDSADFYLEGVVGVGHIYNFAAACAVAHLLEIPLSKVAEKLTDFTPAPGRMRVIEGIKNTVIIDDTYNSSPTALDRALSTMHEMTGFQRKIAVIGDMLELGRFSVKEHEEAGEQVAECADILVTVGVRSQRVADGALKAGMSEKNIIQYDESERAGRELQNFIQPGDLLLIKGSQGMRMEKIVLDIMREPENAEKLLVRQSRAWQDI